MAEFRHQPPLPWFPTLEPPGMVMRCCCGHAEPWPYRYLVKLGVQPAGAVSMWTRACHVCASAAGAYVWGWTLHDGKEVSCLAGLDAAEAGGAIPMEHPKRRLKK